MSLKLEEISPENELQQNLEQLNIVDNDGYECDADDNLREHEEEGLISCDQEQDRKPTLDNSIGNEKTWNVETTCRSEDGSHEIGSNIINDNEKDATSSVDESDYSLPKHRKDCPSDDERTDSESLSNEEEELASEESNYRPASIPYEQMTPTKPSNTHLQVNGANVPFEISSMSFGDSSQYGIDVTRVINPIMRSIADLKSEFRTQLAKFHYCADPNLDGIKVDENWQHIEFEKPQDQHRYDAIVTAGKLLDVIMPLQLPEEVKEHLAQARHILWEKSLLCCISSSTENTNLPSSNISQDAYDIDPAIVDSALVTPPDNDMESDAEYVPSNTNDNNKSSKGSGGEYNDQTSTSAVNKAEDQTNSTAVDRKTTINNESNNNSSATTSHKYQRGSTQGRKLRRHSARGASSYSSPKSGRRSQNYSPRTPNVRSPRVGNTVISSIASSTTNVLQANNRRFVGFLPSRCFTCGGIGHFANCCPNKGSYITANTSNNQQLSRRRRSNTSRFGKTVSASNE
jgi:hypothetical protein